MSRAAPDREGWSRALALLDQALDLPPEEREAFLDRTCAGDPAGRVRLAALLDSAERDADSLEGIAARAAALILEDLARPEPRRSDTFSEVIASGSEADARPAGLLNHLGRAIRGPVAAWTGVILVTAVVGIYVAALTAEAGRLRVEVERLESGRSASEREVRFLRDLVAAAAREEHGSTVTRPAETRTAEAILTALDDAARRTQDETAGDPVLRARLQTIIGEIYLGLGADHSAETHLRAAIALHQKAGNQADLSATLTLLSTVLRRLGRIDESEEMRVRARTAATP